jgi:integrase
METNAQPDPEKESNIIPLPVQRQGRIATTPTIHRARFRILDFANASGSRSYRVQGMKRDGTYVRQNFASLADAQLKQVELEAEYRTRTPEDAALRATKLTETQLKLAELAFVKLERDEDLLLAINYWQRHGQTRTETAKAPRLDDAVEQFKVWLTETTTLRKRTKDNLRLRVSIFKNSVANAPVDQITADDIEAHLAKRNVSPSSKDNDRRAISRFFAWCIERPRRWMTSNPCAVVAIEKPTDAAPPQILTVTECKQLLRGAERTHGGALVPYVAVCLFGGLRPEEAARLNWQQVNLADGEIRLEAGQTKTGCSRVIVIDAALRAWLTKYKDRPFYPSNWRRMFRAVKLAAGFGTPDLTDKKKSELKPWVPDLMRHTAISHFFRQSGSYGLTAERHGNSEQIIKAHYQGRVTSADTKKFYALRPKRR